MNCDKFIQPTDKEICGQEFLLSKIPGFYAKPVYEDLIGKIREHGELGRTMLSEESMRTIFKYVGIKGDDGNYVALDSTLLIEKKLPNYKTILAVVLEMEKVNFDFLDDGSLQNLLGLEAVAETESAS